jgi:hypothetical protein
LADYRRFADPGARLAVLVPERPRADLMALLKSENVEVIWPTGGGFADTCDGSVT